MASFPGSDRLGYGINLLDFTPFDIGSTDSRVLRGIRLMSIDSNNFYEQEVDGVTYRVPSDVRITDDNQLVRGEYISFPDGRDAASRFRTQADLQYRYFSAYGPASAMIASDKSFLEQHQYAFFTYSRSSFVVRRQDYYDSLVERVFLIGLENVPRPFDSSNRETVAQYETFFREYGSHVIHSVHYGSRYPLSAWASDANAAVNERFNTYIRAKFNGIPSGGDFDPSVRNEAAYRQFDEYLQHLITVSGGGEAERSRLVELSATYPDYLAWIDSIGANRPFLQSFEITDVWTLLRFAESAELRSYAGPLNDAFIYLVGNREIYETHVSLDIQSDWAEFNLLTPSAVIIPDPSDPYPDDGNTVASDTRVQWGRERSHQFERKTLRFFVVNDGSHLDFSISRGSLRSTTSERGIAIVTIEGENYTNDVITDDIWNTRWFFNAPVSTTPVPRRTTARTRKIFNNWSDTLREYLAQKSETS